MRPHASSLHVSPCVPSTCVPSLCSQAFAIVALDEKMDVVWGFVKAHLKVKTIVFLSTCKQVWRGFGVWKVCGGDRGPPPIKETHVSGGRGGGGEGC